MNRHLLPNIQKSVVVVAVVVVGLILYANTNGEEVRWELVLYIALGMVASSLINAWIDERKERVKDKV
jgi:type IV secretory pathway VirB2 component (pilin)